MARICVAGLWHQGTVLTASFAAMGHDVAGVDTDAAVVAALNAGRPPLHEPGLPEAVAAGMAEGRLRYTSDFAEAVAGADLVYLSLDTPVGADDASDLEPLFDVARRIGDAVAAAGAAPPLCVTAQVPVGTSRALAAAVADRSGAPCAVAYVPEFLRLGTALDSFRNADRIVIGADDDALAGRLAELYAPLGRPIAVMDVRSAEMTKHASNAFLATSISFINEIADLCEEVGADASRVAAGMKLDRRIGPHAFLSPGLGFAGGTLGRDLRALQELGGRTGRSTRLTDAVLAVNASRAGKVRGLLERLHGGLEGLRVAVLGLTYKPGTSTLRRSVALEIIADLASGGATIRAFDPAADLDEVDALPPFEPCADAYAAAAGADAVIITTGWPEFRDLDLDRLRAAARRPDMVDTQNLLDPDRVVAGGWSYYGVGRRSAADMADSRADPRAASRADSRAD